VIHSVDSPGYIATEEKPKQSSTAIPEVAGTPAWSSDFVRRVWETYATQIGVLGLGVFINVIAARILGPARCGQYAVAVAIGAAGVQLGNMGLHTSNTYVIAKDRQLLHVLLANSLVISALIGVVAATVTGFLFVLRPAFAPINGTLLVLSLVWIPIGLAQLLAQGLLVGVQETGAFNQIELKKKLLALCFIGCLFMWRNITPEAVFAASLIALGISLILSVSRLWRVLPRRPTPSLSLFKCNFGMGAKAYLASFFAFLVLRLDLIMVKYMLGAEQAGYYSIAANLADCILLLPAAVAMILFPKLSAMSDTAQKLRFANKAAFGAGALLLLLAVIAGVLARPVVQLLFGTAFLPAVGAFILLLPGVLFLGIQTIIVQFLNSMGFPVSVVIAWLFICTLNIGMNLWAIPTYGIRGASLVSSICYTLMAFLVLMIIQQAKYIQQPTSSEC
jgi:O-antigen/teichoic acid export membrane protein